MSRESDLEAVSDYFSFLIPAPKSIFKKIRKVLPGHYVVVSVKGIRDVQYWDIKFAETMKGTEEEWCERLLDTYREAVRLRQISDVPLGRFFPAGLIPHRLLP